MKFNKHGRFLDVMEMATAVSNQAFLRKLTKEK